MKKLSPEAQHIIDEHTKRLQDHYDNIDKWESLLPKLEKVDIKNEFWEDYVKMRGQQKPGGYFQTNISVPFAKYCVLDDRKRITNLLNKYDTMDESIKTYLLDIINDK